MPLKPSRVRKYMALIKIFENSDLTHKQECIAFLQARIQRVENLHKNSTTVAERDEVKELLYNLIDNYGYWGFSPAEWQSVDEKFMKYDVRTIGMILSELYAEGKIKRYNHSEHWHYSKIPKEEKN